MTTWAQVQDFVRQQYALRRDDGSQLIVAVPLGDAGSDPSGADARTELVHLQPVSEFDEPWLLLRVAVCSARQLDIPAALQRSAQQVLGALVLADNLLALRHGLPLATARREDVARTLKFLARTAAYMREQLRAVPPVAPPAEAGAELDPEPQSEKVLFSPWND